MIFSERYEVIEKVGQGGMGIVYRVRHVDLDNVLALKILPRELSQDAELVERFRNEARVMARLDHKNIVRVYDFAKDGETYYLIMEFLKGRNLRQVLQASLDHAHKPMPLEEVLRVGLQTADALAYAHQQNPAVVHRDIKPSNIIIEEGTDRAVVTDFGIAKLLGEKQTELTHTGLFVGTVKFASPEQLRHDDDLDGRVDIYALGMMLFELYAGKHYFAGLKDHEIIGRVLYEKKENTVEFPDAPPEFARLVARAICLERDQRYATAALLRNDLQACIDLVGGGGTAAAPVADEALSAEDLEKQIQALQRRQGQQRAEKARTDCRRAREAAEQAGAETDAPEAFAAAAAAVEEAEQQLQAGAFKTAREGFEGAAAAFTDAAAAGARHRQERTLERARATAAELAERASALSGEGEPTDTLVRARQHVTEAERLAQAGEAERASALFGEAAEEYGAAITHLERARALAAMQEELPAVEEAKRHAEEVDASSLAADAFAAAVRDKARLEAALSAGHLTTARELITTVREEFAAAASAAEEARAKKAVAAVRSRADRARLELEATAGEQGDTGVKAQDAVAAAAREAEAKAASEAGDWPRAEQLYGQAADLYASALTEVLARVEQRRSQQAVREARAAMEAARAAAEEARAAEGAPTLFGRALELVEQAGAEAERDEADAAIADYQRAAEEFAQAGQVAARRIRREAVERVLAEVATARGEAEAAGAAGRAQFESAAAEAAKADQALAADDLTMAGAAAEAARAAYVEAREAAELAVHLAAADEALQQADARRAEARAADADERAPGEWQAAEKRMAEARERRSMNDWQRVVTLAQEAEAGFEAAVVAVVAACHKAAVAAHAAAEEAGVPPDAVAAAVSDLEVAAKEAQGGRRQEAIAKYREAEAEFREATARTSQAASEARTAAEEARSAAEAGDARAHAAADLVKAEEAFAAAEQKAAGEHFKMAVEGFQESARLFAAAAATATKARTRQACATARQEAQEARTAAEQADAGALAGRELGRATAAFAEAEQAEQADDLTRAETAFREAATAFAKARDVARRAAAEREVGAARDRAQSLRGARDPRSLGFMARRRLGRADEALQRAAQAFERGELAGAKSEFEQAAAVLEELPAAAAAATSGAGTVVQPVPAGGDETVIGRAPAPSRQLPWVPIGGAALAVVAAVGLWLVMRPGEERAGPPIEPATPPIAAAPGVEEPAKEPAVQPTQQLAVAPPAVAPEPPEVAPEPTVVPVPPSIEGFDPSTALVRGESGARTTFTVELADARDATYRWSLGGETIADADGPTLSIALPEKETELKVVARTAAGEDSHAWRVAALPRATAAPPPVAQAPRIVERSPSSSRVDVAVGERQTFRVAARAGAGDELRYAWTLDGSKVGDDSADWRLSTGAADEGDTRKVAVTVTGEGGAASASWTVRVPAEPVTLAQRPAGAVTASIGDTAELAVDARVGTRTDVPLTYRWSVDGRRVASATGPRFQYEVAKPSAQVEVEVDAAGGPERRAAVGRWTVRGRAAPTPADPTRLVRGEVEAWIETYRRAYEQKNVDRLVQIGVLNPAMRDRMGRRFDDLEDYRVRIASQSIDVKDGAAATVRFTRVDSFLQGGRRREEEIPITKTLRKQGGGWVAQ